MVRFIDFKKIIHFIVLLVLVGCAHQTRKDQSSLRSLFSKNNFKEASELLEESTLKKEKKNKLLYLMESGSLAYYSKDYKKASDIFLEANDLVDKLYTKSIREKLASSILNENSETFYGSIFERSMLFYYQAMSFYQLASAGEYDEQKKNKDGKPVIEKVKMSSQEIDKTLDKVRSTLIAWDTFFQDLRRSFKGKTILKHDLVSKILAAELHERLSSRRDLEIAMILYQDALKIFKNYAPAFKAFNKKFKMYNAELKEYLDANKDPLKISNKHKDLTPSYQSTLDYLHFKILKFYKLKRSFEYKRELAKFKPSQSVLAELKTISKNSTSFLIEIGEVQELKAEDYSYNLRSAIDKIEDPTSRALVDGIGVPILTYFAAGPLGLGYVSHHGNVSIYTSHNAGTMLTKEIGIEFEMAKVQEPSTPKKYFLEIYQDEKMIQEQELDIVAPISGVSYINSEEVVANNFEKRATRVGIKYALAIAAAYTTYKRVQDTSGELFAKPAALTQFLISQKGIKRSESADTRHWTTIPERVVACELNLKPGEYIVKIVSKDDTDTRVLSKMLGKIKISAENKSLFSYRLF